LLRDVLFILKVNSVSVKVVNVTSFIVTSDHQKVSNMWVISNNSNVCNNYSQSILIEWPNPTKVCEKTKLHEYIFMCYT